MYGLGDLIDVRSPRAGHHRGCRKRVPVRWHGGLQKCPKIFLFGQKKHNISRRCKVLPESRERRVMSVLFLP